MDKIDETYAALVEFLRRPLEAGTTTVWPGVDHLVGGLTLVDAHALAVLEEARLLALQYIPPDRLGALPFRFDRLQERLGGAR